jgi:hypothetical protein
VSLTGQKSKEGLSLRSIILQPKVYIQEATYKEAELKSLLYQAVFTLVLCPIVSSSIKKRRASSERREEAEEEDGDGEEQAKIGEPFPNTEDEMQPVLAALKKYDCVSLVLELQRQILDTYKEEPGMEFLDSDYEKLGDFIDSLMKIIDAKGALKSDLLNEFVQSFFKLFFRKSQVRQVSESADVSQFFQLSDFKCKQPWNDGLMRRDEHDDGLVPNTSFCLWTALHLAMIDAGVPEMSGEIDRQKIKEQCLGFMLNDERAKQTTGKFKNEFANMRFRSKNGDVVQNFGVSEFYEVLL